LHTTLKLTSQNALTSIWDAASTDCWVSNVKYRWCLYLYLRYIVAQYSTTQKSEIVVGFSTDPCTYLRICVCDRRAIGTLLAGDPHRWNHFLVVLTFVNVTDKLNTQWNGSDYVQHTHYILNIHNRTQTSTTKPFLQSDTTVLVTARGTDGFGFQAL